MYFPNAFAEAGDQTAIPETGTEIGPVSFQYGWGSSYSLNLETDVSALPVPRLPFNYLLYQITLTLQEIYQTGLPPWITSAENLGTPFSYNSNVMTLGPDGFLYFGVTAANTTTPGTSPSNWSLFNPTWFAHKGNLPLASVTGGTYSFATLGTGCTLTYTQSGGAINAVSAVVAGGTNYKVGDLITPNDGNQDASIRVATVSGTAVATVTILYGGTGMAGGTANATQKSKSKRNQLTLTGVLAGAATIILPNGPALTDATSWIVSNNTTGAFATTVFVSNGSDATTGTGVVIPQGTANSRATMVFTDGATDVWLANSPGKPMITLLASPGSNLVAGTTYLMDGGSLISATLPASPTDGDAVKILGAGAGGYHVAASGAVQIRLGAGISTATTGYIYNNGSQWDQIELTWSATLGVWLASVLLGNPSVH